MTFQDWLIERSIDPAKAVCVTVGTDGLSTKKDNLLAVSLYSQDESRTIFVQGASPDKNMEYTGISNERYRREAVLWKEALSEIEAVLQNASFGVMYNEAFTNRWMHHGFPLCVSWDDLPKVDVTKFFKLHSIMETLPKDVGTVRELAARMLITVATRGSLPAFATIAHDLLGDAHVDRTLLEMKPAQLYDVYQIMLMMDF